MSRLTTKIDTGFYVADHAHNTDEVTHKLGKLEDLEEELGCPLEDIVDILLALKKWMRVEVERLIERERESNCRNSKER